MNTLTIARFTIQEAISRRLILAGVVVSLLFLALFALGYALLYGEAIKSGSTNAGPVPFLAIFGSLLTVMGLYAVHFLSSFIALFLSVGAVSGEIDSGTLHAVLARPIRRAEYIAGRWLAYAGLVAVYVGVMATLLLLITQIISGYQVPDPVRAIGLMMVGSVSLLSISLFGSTLLSTLANGVVVFTVFALAWLGGMIEFVGNVLPNQSMVDVGIVVSLLVPSDAIWRGASFYVQSPAFVAAASTTRGSIPFAAISPPSGAFVVWAVCYPLIFLVAANVAFARRDL